MLKTGVKTKLKQIFGIRDFKYIFKLTLPIFIQTLFFALVSVVGSLATTMYYKVWHIDGSYNGYYFYTFAKILTVYKILTFIPLIYQLGVLVLASNLFGQKKEKDIPKVLWSSIYVSLLINFGCYLIMFFSAPAILSASGAKASPIIAWKTQEGYQLYMNNVERLKAANISAADITQAIYGGSYQGIILENTKPLILETSELAFTVKFIRLTTLDIFLASIALIFVSALQAIEKNNYAIIGIISSIFIRTAFTYSVLFIPNGRLNLILLISMETVVGALINLVISYAFVYHFIFKKYKIKVSETWNNRYIREVIKLGLPIALETGIWFIAQYMIASAIPYGNLDAKYVGLWRAVNNTYDIFNSFVMALSYVTTVIVGIEIGKQDFKRAHSLGNSSLKLGFYAQTILSICGLLLTWPSLKIYSIDTAMINQVGYFVVGLMMLKAIFDIGNLTTLRALWGANDVWMPNFVALLTMIGVQLSAVYMVAIFQNTAEFKLSQGIYIILLTAATLLDPIFRTILFGLRWNSYKWTKYAKKL
ncbi:MATE family efflux transporter [Metamycoplasma neophronis]|nr:MATE family efflux transporter [Metamycoplasma neophronis]